ncbi:phosphatase PAP2 family protein [Caballeronia humi]|uniref:PAP2 family protein n=1 Tax=Caballeronia humi TaxID=326474 RepID=A0A158H4N5_9BURK|nr:phosphatase PAP2 family protein [Caballeronia humi]SAL39284.1 PAP2 family protein [Caballeronia humi]
MTTSSPSLWYSITALGSVGVMIPLALAVALWLALGYSRRYALGWLGLLAGAVGLVFLSKIAFIGWGMGVRGWDFTGISGHAMVATAVLPAAFFVAFLPARGAWRAAGVSVGLVAGVVVGVSRIVVGAHSASEVIAGCALGALVAVGFARIAWRAEAGRLSPAPVAASLAAVAITLHGVPVPSHQWITQIALELSGHERPYVRARWKAGHHDAPMRRTEVVVPHAADA